MIIRRFLTAVFSICAIVSAHAADQPANKANPTSQKILFLGNSITLHSPAPDIGWTGNWGMAASSEDKDYVHLVTAGLAKSFGSPPKTMVRNVAGFEREYATFEASTKLKEETEFGAGIIIVAIGENVPELVRRTPRKRSPQLSKSFLPRSKEPESPPFLCEAVSGPRPSKTKSCAKKAMRPEPHSLTFRNWGKTPQIRRNLNARSTMPELPDIRETRECRPLQMHW